jgi:hypothetical protein
MSAYHARYDVLIANTLENLQRRNIPVGDLMTLSKNVTSPADVRKLSEGFKRINNPSANYMSLQLSTFLSRMDPSQRALFQAGGGDQASQASKQAGDQMVKIYRSSYSQMIDENLKRLQAQHVPVEDLLLIQKNLTSTDDIQRLADGFKKLADSIAP